MLWYFVKISAHFLKSPGPHPARPPAARQRSGHPSLAVFHGIVVLCLQVRGRVRVRGVQASPGRGHNDCAPALLFLLQQLFFLSPLDVLDRLGEDGTINASGLSDRQPSAGPFLPWDWLPAAWGNPRSFLVDVPGTAEAERTAPVFLPSLEEPIRGKSVCQDWPEGGCRF